MKKWLAPLVTVAILLLVVWLLYPSRRDGAPAGPSSDASSAQEVRKPTEPDSPSAAGEQEPAPQPLPMPSDAEIAELLVRVQNPRNPEQQRIALEKLALQGAAIVEPLFRATENATDRYFREDGIRVVCREVGPEAAGPLVRRISEEGEELSELGVLALDILGRLGNGSPEVIECLRECLTHADAMRKLEATLAVGRLGNKVKSLLPLVLKSDKQMEIPGAGGGWVFGQSAANAFARFRLGHKPEKARADLLAWADPSSCSSGDRAIALEALVVCLGDDPRVLKLLVQGIDAETGDVSNAVFSCIERLGVRMKPVEKDLRRALPRRGYAGAVLAKVLRQIDEAKTGQRRE